jgi:beta-galactosidase
MLAIKKAQQYVLAKPIDLSQGLVEVQNWYDFSNLQAKVRGEWLVTADGIPIQEGALPDLDLDPRGSERITVPMQPVDAQPGVEYFLELRWLQRHDTAYAKAGHEVAWEQFRLPTYRKPQASDPTPGRVELEQEDETITLNATAAEVIVAIDRATGLLIGCSHEGHPLITQPLHPSFWRAPTDNDRGNRMPNRQAIWKSAGASWKLEKLDVERLGPKRIQITAKGAVQAITEIGYTLQYTMSGNGEVYVKANMRQPQQSRELADLPRFGLTTRVEPAYDRLTWLGIGPEESYFDRDEYRFGRWQSPVAEQYFSYSDPQETGNHVATRWLALTNDSGSGLAIFADRAASTLPEQSLSFSALPYSLENIELARHDYDLKPLGGVELHLDMAQMGVGGDDSWGARQRKEYRLPARDYKFAFWLRPISAMNEIDLRRQSQ